ncbi:MAG: hypothetical protein GY862_35805, partial [Gammaproteobacteria bacterium]|nr:hypothetical protein [Gammaproteobacteria bacterium]
VSDFAGLRDFIEVQAGKNYRFVVILDEFERLAGNSHFNSDFFANLRTLGCESKYCLGWLTASRESLEKLCREHCIEESSFWNIFICHELGLLSAKEAKDLIRVPALLSLERAPDIEQVLLLAGAHPAFIQIALSGLWENIKHDRQPDWREIRRQLRPHCEKLWHDCSPAEQKILLEIRAGRVPADKTALEDLQVRGLLDEQGHLFSALFAELLPAWQPKEPGKSLQAGIANAEQATEQVSKLHKVYNSFRKIIRELRTDWQGKPDKPEHEDDKEDRI